MIPNNRTNLSQNSLLVLAKQGRVDAINESLNYIMQKLGVTVRAFIKETVIELIVEKTHAIPEKELSIKYIKNFLEYIKIPSLNQVIIYGKKSGSNYLAWSNHFYLQKVNPSYPQISTNSSYNIQYQYSKKPSVSSQKGVLGTSAACVQVQTPNPIPFVQLPQSLQARIRRAGLRKGETRSWQEAKQMYEMMPENVRRQGVESIEQFKRTHDWSHKKAHSKGGSNSPHNCDWEKRSINHERGSRNMSKAEDQALVKAKAKINFQSGKSIVINKAVTAGGIGFGVELAFSGLENFLAVQRGEKSVEQALIHTLANSTGVAITAAVVTGGVVALSLVFPPIGIVGNAVAPFLQIVGVVAGVERLIGILSNSGKVEGMDQITALMASYGIDSLELDFRDLEVSAELDQMKLALALN